MHTEQQAWISIVVSRGNVLTGEMGGPGRTLQGRQPLIQRVHSKQQDKTERLSPSKSYKTIFGSEKPIAKIDLRRWQELKFADGAHSYRQWV